MEELIEENILGIGKKCYSIVEVIIKKKRNWFARFIVSFLETIITLVKELKPIKKHYILFSENETELIEINKKLEIKTINITKLTLNQSFKSFIYKKKIYTKYKVLY